MANRKPLVVIDGQIQQLSSSDVLDAAISEQDVTVMTNGEAGAVVIGAPVYASAADTFKKAKADAAATANVIGLAKDASTAGSAAGNILTNGVLTATTTQWDAVAGTTGGLTYNTKYYLDPTTAGKITATAPTTAGEVVVEIGVGLSTVDLKLNIQQSILL